MNIPVSAAPRAGAPWGRIIGALALAVVLVGCSTVSLGYNRAATLAYWWINGLVDLEPAQGRQLRTGLDALHRWHRENELPAYASQLREWQALARSDLNPAQVCAVFGQVRQRLVHAGQESAPVLGRLAASLSDAQLDHMRREHAKSNDSFRRDYAGEDRGLEQRLRQAVRRAEMFYGRLSAEQRALLREHLARSSFDADRIQAERERRQADIIRAVALARDGRGESAALGVLQRLADSPTPGWRDYAERLTREGCEQFAALHNRTTPEQRERAAQALAGYERDIVALAQQD